MKPKPLNLSKKHQGWRASGIKPRKRKSSIIKNRLKANHGINLPKANFFRFFTKKNIFIAFLIMAFLGVLTFSSVVLFFSRGLPTPGQLIAREVPQSTIIYDRTGEEVLYEIHGSEKRTLIQLEDIPKYVQHATIAIEDKNFYEHKGFSLWAIFRTAITNVIYGRKAGASTLTQQFIKNSLFTNEKRYSRKIKEFILAYKMEKEFTKDEILQMYLNEIPYGSTAYGVEAASQRFFDKSVRDINLAEAAILAAIPQAPSRYSPYGPNREILIGRQHYILDQMAEQGYISQEEADAAKNYELVFEKPREDIKAPHFVMYIKEQLSEKYGEKMVEQGGLRIYTTLDLYKQEIAERIISEKAEKNMENYNASNAALVSIDPKTGEILAMVGSKDYFSDEIDGQVNIATSLRQPGSSMKPLVYSAMFLKGYQPNTILYDVVTNFTTAENEVYEPHNYDNKEHGPVSIRKALAGSLNIPAVKAIYLAGIDNVLDLANELGYTSLTDKNRYGLSLVLGGGEVKLLEHVNAYSAFAREGKINKITSILKVEDPDGNILEENKPEESKVLDPKAARMINNVLSDNEARAYAFGLENWLNLGSRPVAAKTGTTNDYRDAWTIGYTPSIVTGVWVGNNDNSEMKRGAAGGVVAAPIWHDFMKEVLGDTPIEYFKEPELKEIDKPLLNGEAGTMETIKIDLASEKLATNLTPESFIEERTYLQPHSILHYVDKNKPLGDIPENPERDPQYDLWEEAVMKWALDQASSTESVVKFDTPPEEEDDLHIEDNIPRLLILSPENNQNIDNAVLNIRVSTSANRGVDRVEYYLDNNLFSVVKMEPYTLTKRIDFLNNGFHNIKIRSCDDIDNCTEKELEFNLALKNNNRSNKQPSVEIINPGNGLSVMDFDFPLNITMEINNPSVASKINLYIIDSQSNKKLLSSIEPVESELINYQWESAPPSDTYKLEAEIINWNNNSFTGNERFISVTNNQIEDESTEETTE